MSLPARYVLYGAALLHGLPWAALLLGGLIGAVAGKNDLSCFLGAVLALALTLMLTSVLYRKLEIMTADRLRVFPSQ